MLTFQMLAAFLAGTFLLHDGEDIYAAVKSPAIGITSIYVARCDELKILHASAAIGDAAYRRQRPATSFQPPASSRRFELIADS